MQTVESNGACVAYTQHGDGPGLMLIHGTGASGVATWSPVLEQLAQSHTVLVPDLRGSGATSGPDEPLKLSILADDIIAVATAAGFEEFDLVGFSLGGAVAAAVAAADPGRVRSLILIATSPSGTDSRSRLQFEFWKDLYAQDAKLFARYWLLAGLSPDFVAAIPSEELSRASAFPIEPGLERQCTLNTQVDLRPILAAIRARTLVIGCKHDAIVPAQPTRALAKAIPTAKYRELDTGHMVILEAPAAIAREILKHVAAGECSTWTASRCRS